MLKSELEGGKKLNLNFKTQNILPVVTIDTKSKEVLMVAYMNEEALQKTLATKEAHYFSRSRNKLWRKGETSGFIQKVVEVKIDCDQDSILLEVEMVGGACCHVGYRSCFYRKIIIDQSGKLGLEFTENSKIYDPKEVYK
ncbi:MAG: phosphoribosyl-AMP cyclohydrolase [Rickettsiales bacterium]